MNRLLLALSAFCLSASPAAAQEHISLYYGLFDITQGDDDAAQFGVEYRHHDVWEGVRPALGFNFTDDGGLYAYGGVVWEAYEYENFLLVPNFVAGMYSNGDGKDLGNGVEFRSGIEVQYRFENDHRIGVAFNHISNGILGDHNPGAETLLFSYQLPLSSAD